MTSEQAVLDAHYMARALELARKGLYTTHPNPRVGCVIVRDGQIVGEGWHERTGEPHAEPNALRAAGDKARGATVYVTLEPCSHHGRTPPCADALVSAGVALWLPRRAKALNALLLGESEASHLGIDVEGLKRELVFCTALGVGAAVAAAGMIGFVGLVVPHLVRLLAGPDHRVLLPASVLAGASLLLFADLVARLALAPAELPIGIVTAFIGAPFFLYLLLRGRA